MPEGQRFYVMGGGTQPERSTSGTTSSGDDLARQRAIQLYTYLREYVQLRSRRVLNVEDYRRDGEGAVLWLDDLPRVPGCHAAVFDEDPSDDEIWLSVRRPAQRKAPPSPATHLRRWMDLGTLADSKRDEPHLLDEIQDDRGGWTELAEHPEVREAYRRYVAEWTPWRDRDRELVSHQEIYTELFRIHQQQARLGEAYEAVVGLGLLTWRPPSGGAVRRHLLVAQADVRFDARSGVVTVAAAADGARLGIEEDMLEPEDRPSRVEMSPVEQLLSSVGDDVFGDESVAVALRSWVHAASPRGSFDAALTAPREAAMDPRVTLAPALILRRRSDRSLAQMMGAIADQLKAGAPVPDSVRRLVESTAPPTGAGAVDGDILFPLPANDEQLQVVRKLRSRAGVLVQGPPGTGKSHTTANLVSHLLAEGKRVLVTSHTARALEVLRAKIPPPVRQLAVVVLGNDISGRQEMQMSVRSISNRYAGWSDQAAREAINAERRDLESATRRETELTGQLRALRKRDCEASAPPHATGYLGSPAAIAQRVTEEASRFDWTRDLVPAGECPLTNAEGRELSELLTSITESEKAEVRLHRPAGEKLPALDDFEKLVESERRAASEVEEVAAARAHPHHSALARAASQRRDELASALHTIWRAREDLRGRPYPWLNLAADQVLASQAGPWRQLEQSTRQELERVRHALGGQSPPIVTGLEGLDPGAAAADARELLAHARRGGSLGRGLFRSGLVKRTGYLQERVRVDGMLCRDASTLERLVAMFDAEEALDRLDWFWSAIAGRSLGPPSVRAALYEDQLRLLDAALHLEELQSRLGHVILSIPGLATAPWRDHNWALPTLQALELIRREEHLAERRRPLTDLHASIANHGSKEPHPVALALAAAVRRRDVPAYGDALETLAGAAERQARVARFRRLMSGVAGVTPRLERELERSHGGAPWDERLQSIEQAWAWRQADLWLSLQSDDTARQRLLRDLDAVRDDVHQATAGLVAALAWTHCLSRMTEGQRKSLMAWETAQRRIGKGTGKMAPHWRRQAQQAMEECRDAIPAWIMPTYKVAESVVPRPNAFDVVIVDEASQSGPEALFLHYLAPRIIVIGDDQQISPENAGVDRTQVDQLIRDHLQGVPHAVHFGADSSLFDLTRIHYPDQIVLREHFRCVPEIIEFSNRLCYEDRPLIPLKQFGRNRLSPPIRTAFVEAGSRSTGNVNGAEAEALVERLAACLRDPAYRGKTMGVISLVGEGQARHIRRLLSTRVSPEELAARDLDFGDAYAFQGNERDVMFLSLVQARSGHRLYALTRDTDKRRFNVAASRAREQMWLFHSVTPQDLNPESMAARLLEYCLQPRVEPTPVDDSRLEEIRRRAAEVERGRVPLPFQSWFQVDVYLGLVDRGYRVIPQYEVGGLRLDLVVEGTNTRLAVECEDDRWPGDEEFARRLQRQRALERSGMRFGRVRAVTFYRDRERAWEPIFAALSEAGIRPAGNEEEASSGIVTSHSPGTESPLPTTSMAVIEPTDEGRTSGESQTVDLFERLSAPGQQVGETPLDETLNGGPAGASPSSRVVGTPQGTPTVPYQVKRIRVASGIEIFDPEAGRLIRSAITDVLEVEGPIHEDLLLHRVRRAWGLDRAGRRVQEAFQRQLGIMSRSRTIEIDCGFVRKLPRRELSSVRVPTGDPETARAAHQIPPEELELAVEMVVSNAGAPGIYEDEVSGRVAWLFGWRRRGHDIQDAIENAISHLVVRERVQRRGSMLASQQPSAGSDDTWHA